MERGTIRALAWLHYLKTETMRRWQQYNNLYASPRLKRTSKPKWGQPGRGRRRKARLAAQRSEASRQELRREVKRIVADPGTFTVPLHPLPLVTEQPA